MKYFLLITLMFSSFSTYAAVTKWVDENNQVHYSDQPAPGSAKFKQQLSKPEAGIDSQENISSEGAVTEGTATESDKTEAPKTLVEREAELKKSRKAKQEAEEKLAQEQAKAEAQKENCANARSNLKSLQSGIRISEFDANGERYFIDDEQRQQRIDKIQQNISVICQ